MYAKCCEVILSKYITIEPFFVMMEAEHDLGCTIQMSQNRMSVLDWAM